MNDRDHSPHGRREESPRNHKAKSYSRSVGYTWIFILDGIDVILFDLIVSFCRSPSRSRKMSYREGDRDRERRRDRDGDRDGRRYRWVLYFRIVLVSSWFFLFILWGKVRNVMNFDYFSTVPNFHIVNYKYESVFVVNFIKIGTIIFFIVSHLNLS